MAAVPTAIGFSKGNPESVFSKLWGGLRKWFFKFEKYTDSVCLQYLFQEESTSQYRVPQCTSHLFFSHYYHVNKTRFRLKFNRLMSPGLSENAIVGDPVFR